MFRVITRKCAAAVGVTVLLAALTTIVSAAPAGAATGAGIMVNGHPVSQVLFDGHLLGLNRFARLMRAAEREHRVIGLIIDAKAASRGYALAVHGRQPVVRSAETSRAGAPQSIAVAGPDTALINNCNPFLDFAYYYVDSGCNGSYISGTPGTIIYHLSTYGFNNKISSLVAGLCITSTYTYTDDNLLGIKRTWGGGGTGDYANVPDNDQYSSLSVSSARNC